MQQQEKHTRETDEVSRNIAAALAIAMESHILPETLLKHDDLFGSVLSAVALHKNHVPVEFLELQMCFFREINVDSDDFFAILKKNSKTDNSRLEQLKCFIIDPLIICINFGFGDSRKLLLSASLLAVVSRTFMQKRNRSENLLILRLIVPVLLDIVSEATWVGMVALRDKAAAAVSLAVLLMEVGSDAQLIAVESDIVKKIARLLEFLDADVTAAALQIKENLLLAIASLAGFKEEIRKKILEEQSLLCAIVSYMAQTFSSELRIAACCCIRSLSRSPKGLRTSLADLNLVIPFVSLLHDPLEAVRVAATASLCNLVVEFSALKVAIIDNGALEELVRLIDPEQERNDVIRVNAWWALKNISYLAESSLKQKVLNSIGIDTIFTSLETENLSIQTQILNMIRNCACSSETDIDHTLAFLGEDRIFSVIKQKFGEESIGEEILEQCFFLLVNILTGNERHKDLIFKSQNVDLLQTIRSAIFHQSKVIRKSAVWCVINMTWRDMIDAGSTTNVAHRLKALEKLGVFDALKKALGKETDLNVIDAIKSAISNFDQ